MHLYYKRNNAQQRNKHWKECVLNILWLSTIISSGYYITLIPILCDLMSFNKY